MAANTYYGNYEAPTTGQRYSASPQYYEGNIQNIDAPVKYPQVSTRPVGSQSISSPTPTWIQTAEHAYPAQSQDEQLPPHPLSRFPMFPLYSIHETLAKQRYIDAAAEQRLGYIPKPQHTVGERAALLYCSVAGVSPHLSAVRHFNNAIVMANVKAKELHTKDLATLVLTRWSYTIPSPRIGQPQIILVDVLEYRFKAVHNQIYVKSSAQEEIQLALIGKTRLKLKPGGTQKLRMTRTEAEEAGVHDASGRVQQMERVCRQERPIAPSEWREMRDRFELGWHVPGVR